MRDREDTTFTYEVSDEMLARFATSNLAQRIQWLDEMRTFSWEMASRETRDRWRSHLPRDVGPAPDPSGCKLAIAEEKPGLTVRT